MEIRRRVGLPRMWFHVMNRGARQAFLFKVDSDRQEFVDLMGRFCLKNGVMMTSWCLMTNLYHLEPDSEGTPLSRTMHDLDGTYAKEFNERYQGTGCLFQGPFKSMSIADERGLAYVSRYIHLNNPRDMGADPLTYPWSSCANYLGLRPNPPWLDPTPVLRQFGETLDQARANYRFYLSSAAPRRRLTGENPVDDYLAEYISHLEEECSELLKSIPSSCERVALVVFVCWYACRLEGIPYRVLKEYYGYSSEETVRALVCRFARRVTKEADLALWAGNVNVYATRQR